MVGKQIQAPRSSLCPKRAPLTGSQSFKFEFAGYISCSIHTRDLGNKEAYSVAAWWRSTRLEWWPTMLKTVWGICTERTGKLRRPAWGACILKGWSVGAQVTCLAKSLAAKLRWHLLASLYKSFKEMMQVFFLHVSVHNLHGVHAWRGQKIAICLLELEL